MLPYLQCKWLCVTLVRPSFSQELLKPEMRGKAQRVARAAYSSDAFSE